MGFTGEKVAAVLLPGFILTNFIKLDFIHAVTLGY